MTLAGWRGALWLALLVGVPSFPLIAQQRIPVAGRVVRAGADSTPAAGVRLVLHRVGRSFQGPIDSAVSDARGRFQLRFTVDTTFLYLLSANYSGIEYFSPPINTNPALPDTALVVLVFDTSATQPVDQVARYLVIRRPAENGSRSVLDLIVLANRGAATRVAGDTLRPAWQGFVPRGIGGIRVGEADLSSDAIVFRGDSIMVFAPIAPGEKQIALEYAVPPGTPLRLRFSQDSVATNVLLQDAGARVEGAEMIATDSQVIEGESFHRWIGAPHAGETITIGFGGSGGTVPGWLLPVMVGVAGAGLLIAVLRLRPRRSVVSLEALTDRLAELEVKYAGREGEVTPEEWQVYQGDRTRLRAELSDRIANRRPVA